MKRGMLILGIIIIIVFLIAVFLTFFYYPKCKNIQCWDYKLEKCRHAKFINDAPDIAWLYKIEGKSNNICMVEVSVLQVKQGLTKAKILEGESMQCSLPIGAISAPETDPNLCHGRLREELQTLMIEKLHQYILDNVGEIGRELASIKAITQETGKVYVNITNGSA